MNILHIYAYIYIYMYVCIPNLEGVNHHVPCENCQELPFFGLAHFQTHPYIHHTKEQKLSMSVEHFLCQEAWNEEEDDSEEDD